MPKFMLMKFLGEWGLVAREINSEMRGLKLSALHLTSREERGTGNGLNHNGQ